MAKRDSNRIPAIHASLYSDFSSDVDIVADDTSHRLKVSTKEATDTLENVIRDPNRVPALLAVSSEDGETPVVLAATESGELLIQSD